MVINFSKIKVSHCNMDLYLEIPLLLSLGFLSQNVTVVTLKYCVK